MSLIERPRLASHELRSEAEFDALFEEARRHQRRRRASVGLAAVGLVVLGLVVYGLLAAWAHPSSGLAVGSAGGLAASSPPRVVMFAIDVSGSMAATDLHPTRLEAAISGIDDFVRLLPTDVEIGLVVFSTTTDVAMAPSRDHVELGTALAALMPAGGTSLGDGLTAATRASSRRSIRSGLDHKLNGLVPGVVLLISDGGRDRGHACRLRLPRMPGPLGSACTASCSAPRTAAFGRPKPHSRARPSDPTAVRSIGTVTRGEALDASSAAMLDADLRQIARELTR